MSGERRYADDEVKEIFDRATREDGAGRPAPAPSDHHGLTLAELQSIGQEVGVEPERIADAARSLVRRPALLATRATQLGVPYAVGRTVDLPRAPTEREWELILADLRETFQARGKTGGSGLSRHWTNSNLHAYVEPAGDGYRLRMGTKKGDAAPLTIAGGILLAVGMVMTVTALLAETFTGDIGDLAILVATGVGLLTANALRLPPWARTRERQMEEIAARTLALLGEPPGGGSP